MNADTAFREALAGTEDGRPVATRNGTRIYLGPRLLTYPAHYARITSRPVPDRIVAAEFIWMMAGHCSSINYLHTHNIHIWDKWVKPNGKLGPIYGTQWRDYQGDRVDQVKMAIERLTDNPGDTQALVTAWNPLELADMALPPCHFAHQPILVPTSDGYDLELHVFQRSCDILIGLPFNMSFYGLVAQFYARLLTARCGTPIIPILVRHHISHAHIYDVHLQDAPTREWIQYVVSQNPAISTPPWIVPSEDFEPILASQLPAPETLTRHAAPISPRFPKLRLEVIA
jgi:thymidylate synthase